MSEGLIKDKSDQELLNAGVFSKENGQKKLDQAVEQAINQQVEESWEIYIADWEKFAGGKADLSQTSSKKNFERGFSRWLTYDVTRILDQEKIEELEKSNRDIRTSLQNLEFKISGSDDGEETVEESGEKPEDTKNIYNNTEKDEYGKDIDNRVDNLEEAYINVFLDGKNKNELKKTEKNLAKIGIDPMKLAKIVEILLDSTKNHQNYPKGYKYTRSDIPKKAKKMYGKPFPGTRLARLLNNVPREKLEKFVKDMEKYGFADIRDMQNVSKFVEQNVEEIQKNPFLALSDFSLSGKLDRGTAVMKTRYRWSEQAMYDVFVSSTNTKEIQKGGKTIKEIVDGPHTVDVIERFKDIVKTKGLDVSNFGASTLENLGKFLVDNPEAIVFYQTRLDMMSQNKSKDLADIISKNRSDQISNRKLEEIENLSKNRIEVTERFEGELEKIRQLPEDSKLRKSFEEMKGETKQTVIQNLSVWLSKGGIAQNAVKALGLSGESVIEDSPLTSWHWFEDDAGIGPRLGCELGNGVHLFFDIPIVNFTTNWTVNEKNVKNSDILGETDPIKKLYTRLGANVNAGVKVDGKIDPGFTAKAKAALELAMGIKKDYKEGIEKKGEHLGDVLQNKLFEGADFSSKIKFMEKAVENLDNILKDKKGEFYKFFNRNYIDIKRYIIGDIADSLELMGVFNVKNNQPNFDKNTKILLDTVIKGVVEEFKDKNMEQLDRKTKLTRLGVFGQLSAALGTEVTADGVKAVTLRISAGIEATLSSWNMLYLPDDEKYKYMDETLKSGETLRPLNQIPTDTPQNLKKAVENMLSRNTIPGIKVEYKGELLEISVPDDTLAKYEKNSIYELFNIYVNPDEKDIKVEKNKITLGDVKNLSVMNRRYFDDFAVYLLVGGKGVDGCKNNKVNEKNISNYGAEVQNKFDFTEINQKKQKIEDEKLQEALRNGEIVEKDINFEYSGFDFASMRPRSFGALSYLDNQNGLGGKFLKEMNGGNFDGAKDVIIKMLKTYNNEDFKELENYLNDADVNLADKVQTLDRLKAIFATANVHDTYGLKLNVNQRNDVFTRLGDFPLDKEYALGLRNNIVEKYDGKTQAQIHDDIIGFTAFYAKDNKVGRGYSMTALGNTGVFAGQIENIDSGSAAKTEDWIKSHLEKNNAEYQNVLNTVKSLFPSGLKEKISDENIKEILRSNGEKTLDIGGEKLKISLDKNVVFYLLDECANESLGIQLGKLKITRPKPDQDTPDGPGGGDSDPDLNILNLYGEEQTSTKTSALNQRDLSGKINVWGKGLGGGSGNDNSRSNPGSGDGAGSNPGSGDGAGSNPGSGDGAGSNPGSGDGTGSGDTGLGGDGGMN